MTAVDRYARTVEAFLSLYHRHEVEFDAPFPGTPALVVSNHGFGGIIDLNAMALASALRKLGVHEKVTVLVHQVAWTLGAGRLLELIGARPGSPAAVQEAFAAGRHVAVFPGGDVDAAKSWRDRDGICFAGRTSFARIAIEHDVPIVPVVTAGTGETLARALGRPAAGPRSPPSQAAAHEGDAGRCLDPVGLNVGLVGLLPYLPLPAKLHTAVLPPIVAHEGETPGDLAARVENASQRRLTELVHNRIPLLG